MARARSIFVGFVVGVMLASGTVALAAKGWSWYTGVAEGEVSGSLASLAALEVSDAKGGDGLFPGQVLTLRVIVKNPNEVTLDISRVDVDDLKSGDGTCDDSLQDSRLRFDPTPDVSLVPGTNDVVLGKVKLPTLLANECQGRSITAKVHITAAYGAGS